MNKDLHELNIIRLNTELENAIGFRDYFLKKNDYNSYNVWDTELNNIIDEIINLGVR